MAKQQLTITLSGPAGSGKTSLLLELRDLLNRHGVETEVYDAEVDERHFRKNVSIETVLKALAPKVKVNIQTVQTGRMTPVERR